MPVELERNLIAAFALILTAGCARTLDMDSALTVVPYEIRQSGRVFVDVALNDEGPFRFALDTGSSGSFVFGAATTRLGLVPDPGAIANVRGAVASGRFPIVVVDRLVLGTAVHDDVALIALPGETFATRGIDGVLGADFMRNYAMGFSVRQNVVRIYAPEAVAGRSYDGFSAIPLRPVLIGASDVPLYFLDVTIARNTVPALFDLGAGVNVMNAAMADELELSTTQSEEAIEFAGAVETRPVLARFGTQAIATGSARWRNELFLISDIEIFATLGYADRPLAILGSGLFTQRDFVIDFPRNRLLIRTAMAELEAPAPEAAYQPSSTPPSNQSQSR